MYFAFTGRNPWDTYHSKQEIINAYKQKPDAFYLEEKENITSTDKIIIPSIIEGCLLDKFDDVNKLREQFANFPQVLLYLKDDVLEFDFKKGKND